MSKSKLCEHCNGDKDIRNPTGFCDHLYYPEYCRVCDYLVNGCKQCKVVTEWLNYFIEQRQKQQATPNQIGRFGA